MTNAIATFLLLWFAVTVYAFSTGTVPFASRFDSSSKLCLAAGELDDALLLPALFPRAEGLFEEKLREMCSKHDRLIFYVRFYPSASLELLQITKQLGFELVDVREFRNVNVLVVRRSSAHNHLPESNPADRTEP